MKCLVFITVEQLKKIKASPILTGKEREEFLNAATADPCFHATPSGLQRGFALEATLDCPGADEEDSARIIQQRLAELAGKTEDLGPVVIPHPKTPKEKIDDLLVAFHAAGSDPEVRKLYDASLDTVRLKDRVNELSLLEQDLRKQLEQEIEKRNSGDWSLHSRNQEMERLQARIQDLEQALDKERTAYIDLGVQTASENLELLDREKRAVDEFNRMLYEKNLMRDELAKATARIKELEEDQKLDTGRNIELSKENFHLEKTVRDLRNPPTLAAKLDLIQHAAKVAKDGEVIAAVKDFMKSVVQVFCDDEDDDEQKAQDARPSNADNLVYEPLSVPDMEDDEPHLGNASS